MRRRFAPLAIAVGVLLALVGVAPGRGAGP